ncbi:MAG TPA: sigma-54 dependent transcriptional regulator [Gemmatimonadaceae bacterium]|jgi:DNA-binding NtrC family response regulator|nr:sigma-54 dependent transcriptional regulator [Gemmatimonadaceae bacterium]
MTDTLLVLALSESFSEFWPRLAAAAGMRFEPAGDARGFARRDAVGIVAGGGEEDRLETAFRDLQSPTFEVAAVAAQADHRLVARVLRAGAAEFFLLGQDSDALTQWVAERRDALADRRDRRSVGAEGTAYDFSNILGESAALKAALDQAARIIPHPGVTALITGETGTGKELMARALHDNGPRRDAPFVDVNCAAIPETLLEGELFGHERGAFTDAVTAKPGLFEVADGGTIFLDEIGHTPLPLQGKLLRALEERSVRRVGGTKTIPIDVRVIAATHVNLARAVRRGEFRQDLYYRLNVVPINLPALRARAEDIVPLARHFLARFAREYGLNGARFTAATERILRARDWPGNVRELRNVIERTVLMASHPRIDVENLRDDNDIVLSPRITPSQHLNAIIRNAVHETVERCGGNKSDAARRLGISRTRLQRLLRRGRPVSTTPRHIEAIQPMETFREVRAP